MALQSFQLNPEHTHPYRKVTQLGVDSSKNYSSPVRVDVVDDAESVAQDNQDLESVGITVSTEQTGLGG